MKNLQPKNGRTINNISEAIHENLDKVAQFAQREDAKMRSVHGYSDQSRVLACSLASPDFSSPL